MVISRVYVFLYKIEGIYIPDGITPTEWGGLRLHYKSLCMGCFVPRHCQDLGLTEENLRIHDQLHLREEPLSVGMQVWIGSGAGPKAPSTVG